jgi:hypothetical protein
MHTVLANAINATLAQAIALEQHEEVISQVLGILGCGGATDVRFCGGGTSSPFIVAELADDAVSLGEIEAALAVVDVWFSSEVAAPGKAVARHYTAIPATIADGIGITLLLRLVPAATKAA